MKKSRSKGFWSRCKTDDDDSRKREAQTEIHQFFQCGSHALLLPHCTDCCAVDLVQLLSLFVYCTAVKLACGFARGLVWWILWQIVIVFERLGKELRATLFGCRKVNSEPYLPPRYSQAAEAMIKSWRSWWLFPVEGPEKAFCLLLTAGL
jgi:hypothetical protein